MASKGVSTAGSMLGYAAITSSNASTAPTSFIRIPEVKEVPELNPEPSALETTSLEETGYKTYTKGLKDLGGSIGFTCNLTNELRTVWAAAIQAAAGDDAAGSCWFCVKHPTMGAVVFKGEPSALGMPSMSVDSVLEVLVYVTPTSAPEWASGDVTVADAS